MSNLHWTTQARADLDGIYDYIARHDRRPATADRIVLELNDACQRYADLFVAGSKIGTLRSDLGEENRAFTHKRWVIIFRPEEGGIEVMRIFDGSRDYPHATAE